MLHYPTLASCTAATVWRDHATIRHSAATLGLSLLLLVLFTLILACLSPRQVYAAADGAPAAGLYFRAEGSQDGFAAPQLASDIDIAVHGTLARAKLRQRFKNPTDYWLEGVYVFPLPENAAVDRLTMTVGERRIEGKILKKEKAREVYEKAASEGKKASLLDSERPNVFVTSLANIGPGETVTIEIGYEDRVDYDDGRFQYRFPMVVAPRYTPAGSGDPLLVGGGGQEEGDGDLFGPVSRENESPANRMALRVSLDAGQALGTVESPSHAVDIEENGKGRRLVTLAEGTVSPNKDFVLAWTPEETGEPVATAFGAQLGEDSYLLMELLPPATLPDAARAQPRDLVFVLDTSGSMSGPSIRQAKAALLLALDALEPEDRFNIIRFSSGWSRFARRAIPAERANVDAAIAWVRALEADGGTEMRPALLAALGERPAKRRLRQVVFLTDGAVGNEYELFQTVARRLGDNRLFTVGIGSAPNGFFMRKAAEIGRGSFTWIGAIDEVKARMANLQAELDRPALIDVSFEWPERIGAVEAYPHPLPDLYAGRPLRLTVKLPGQKLSELTGDLVIKGRIGDRPWSAFIPLAKVETAEGASALWARRKIEAIEDRRYKPQAEDATAEAIARDATGVALAHQLVTRYTSLVAVDDRITRPKDKGLTREEIERPLPEGWDGEAVFGPAGPSGSPQKDAAVTGQMLNDTALKSVALPAAAQSRGRSVALPATATPAEAKMLIGAALLWLAGVLLFILRRTAKQRTGHA